MNPDSERTAVAAPGATLPAAEAITLTLALPARLDEAATIHDARLTAPDAAAASHPPTRVRYAILGQAGRGGMATVHVARDLELMRKVALKQLADELHHTASARQRFLREVQVTAQLDHPYIVPVYGLEVAPGGAPAYAMKLVQGRTLADFLRETIAAWEREGQVDEHHALPARLEIFLRICEAVEYAHGKGVIHRDLKPANVMLGEHGETYVMDWGICRLFGQDDPEVDAGHAVADSSGGHMTEFGAVVGTPSYMSPEQAQGRSTELGPASDQCALGLMLFELVTLRTPFAGNSVIEVMQQAAAARLAPIVHAYDRRAIPAPLRAIIARATRAEPGERYGSVRELADDLRRFLRGDAVRALPDSLWQRAQRWVGRHRQGVLLGLLGLVAVAALGAAALMWRHEQALVAAQARERAQRDLLDEVARLGDRLQLNLLSLQNELDALALAATQLLRHGEAQRDVQVYWAEDYLQAARRPQDYASLPGYPRPVSLAHGVWGTAPGVERDAARDQLGRLQYLQGYRNELLGVARELLGGGDLRDGVVELRLMLASGLWMRYPGRQVAAPIDDRASAWYQRVAAQRQAVWGEPYVDAEGDSVLLPLGSALRDVDGTLLGVLSMDLSLEFVVRNLLSDDDGHQILLLDEAARVLASEALLRAPGATDGRIALASFGDASLQAALADDDVGVVQSGSGSAAEWIAFDRIRPLGWLLVLVAPDPDAG